MSDELNVSDIADIVDKKTNTKNTKSAKDVKKKRNLLSQEDAKIKSSIWYAANLAIEHKKIIDTVNDVIYSTDSDKAIITDINSERATTHVYHDCPTANRLPSVPRVTISPCTFDEFNHIASLFNAEPYIIYHSAIIADSGYFIIEMFKESKVKVEAVILKVQE